MALPLSSRSTQIGIQKRLPSNSDTEFVVTEAAGGVRSISSGGACLTSRDAPALTPSSIEVSLERSPYAAVNKSLDTRQFISVFTERTMLKSGRLESGNARACHALLRNQGRSAPW